MGQRTAVRRALQTIASVCDICASTVERPVGGPGVGQTRAAPDYPRTTVETPPPGADAPDDAPLATLPAAPAVVAVVVARDPGDWFEEVIAALAAQDYPNLSILVIDAHSADEVKPRVGRMAPGAFVRRLDEDPGFGGGRQRGARGRRGRRVLPPLPRRRRARSRTSSACSSRRPTDPTPPSSGRSSSTGTTRGACSRSARAWTTPATACRSSSAASSTRRSTTRSATSSPCPAPAPSCAPTSSPRSAASTRASSDFLDDVSLCWRAQIAGARVIVAPDARVRHRDHLATSRGIDERRRIQARHRLRIAAQLLRAARRWRVALPQIIIINIARVRLRAPRRPAASGSATSVQAWTWNLAPPRRAARRPPAGQGLPPRLRPRGRAATWCRGSARLSQFLRGQIGRGEDRFTRARQRRARRGRAHAVGHPAGWPSTVWAAVAVVLLVGSRHLITRGVPAIGEMVSFSSSPLELLRAWASGWRTAGLGSRRPPRPRFGLLERGGRRRRSARWACCARS